MSENVATVRSKRRISKIWTIPLVSLALGLWMLSYSFTHQGPSFEIQFNNADDLVAGKTKIKLLSVDIGVVDSIILTEDASGVVVNARLEKQYASLLNEDTQFWVERARVGTSGVTGLSTLLSGAYIKVLPGSSAREQDVFVGLETPPLTNVNTPGVRLLLESKNASAISTGDPVLFNGYQVGGVESMTLDEHSQTVKYDVFIKAPFHNLVTENVRFWDISGISMKASPRGFDVTLGSLDTVLAGGLSFSLPPQLPPGDQVSDGAQFQLYSSLEKTLEKHYRQRLYYVVSFSQPIGGLSEGSPVVYRGIPVGQVEKVLLKELIEQNLTGSGAPIPVLIYLEPARFELGDQPESVPELETLIQSSVPNGLRASLTTGNLLTGSQLIALDFYPDQPPAELSQFNQYAQIPSISGGIEQIQQSLVQLLDKLNKLPLEQTVDSANSTIQQLNTSLTTLDDLLQSDDLQGVPAQLNHSLGELDATLNSFDATLDSFKALSERLNNSAQLLPVKEGGDLQPVAKPASGTPPYPAQP